MTDMSANLTESNLCARQGNQFKSISISSDQLVEEEESSEFFLTVTN